MSANESYLAFTRFGLGPRPGDLKTLSGDPKAALLAEIADPTALFLVDSGLASTPDAYAQIRQFQRARKMARAVNAGAAAGGTAMMSAAAPGDAMLPAATIDSKGHVSVPGVMSPSDLMNAEIAARLARALVVPIGFGERLVAFWANHFAVQAAANEGVRGLAGAFEREAIRPYVLGKFADMVLAATQHPAMLLSLNNATSIGPNSPQGKKSGKGLNENHARELMELHTVGVSAGYSQADVTSFAKVLTGWTFGRGENEPEFYGRFVFHKFAHEPGPQTVMGKLYAQPGVEQGLAVIADLARHPATATHIATLLAHHFVADDPPPALVDRLATTFRQSGGDLRAVTTALVNAPEAWVVPASKLRTPQEYVLASLRALALDLKPNVVNRTLADLGQPLWNPPSPQGFKDDVATWLAPDAMSTRVEVAQLLAAQDKSLGDPNAIAADLFGPALSPETKTAISRAETRQQGIALLLMSPEFQRR
ncbi:MAG: DUF1800 domain-containing protein [Devosia sp.]